MTVTCHAGREAPVCRPRGRRHRARVPHVPCAATPVRAYEDAQGGERRRKPSRRARYEIRNDVCTVASRIAKLLTLGPPAGQPLGGSVSSMGGCRHRPTGALDGERRSEPNASRLWRMRHEKRPCAGERSAPVGRNTSMLTPQKRDQPSATSCWQWSLSWWQGRNRPEFGLAGEVRRRRASV